MAVGAGGVLLGDRPEALMSLDVVALVAVERDAELPSVLEVRELSSRSPILVVGVALEAEERLLHLDDLALLLLLLRLGHVRHHGIPASRHDKQDGGSAHHRESLHGYLFP